MSTKTDMTLGISVVVTGNIDQGGNFTATASYGQTGSNPDSPGVVGTSGDIDLNNMAFNGQQYNKQTDITFTLSGTVTSANGQNLPFSFPVNPADAISITAVGGGSVDGMTPCAGADAMSLLLDDEDKNGKSYRYCLNIWALTNSPNPGDGVGCQLDPQIVNR